MRVLRAAIPFRTGLIFCVLVSALLWCGRTDAAIQTLFSSNSSVTVDSGSQHGLFNWLIDGVNLAPTEGGGINDYRQWFWYSVGAAAPASVDTLTLVSSPQTANALTLNYAGVGFTMGITITLTGGTVGSGASDIDEAISITNTSGATLPFNFYQYGDFQLDPPTVGSENVTFPDSHTVMETGAMGDVEETVHTPVAAHQEAEPFPVTINKLDNGVNPVTLADDAGAGPGDITWAYQWTPNIGVGGSYIISKDMSATVHVVPEPGTLTLLSIGLAGMPFFRRRRR